MATFEENMAALESVVERLERGELGLEESVGLFEKGMLLSKACKAELASAEGRVHVLVAGPGGEMREAELEVEDGSEPEDEEEGRYGAEEEEE